jgi:hypothetical protein
MSMFLPPIERPFGLSMRMGYNLMIKRRLVKNKTLSQGVAAISTISDVSTEYNRKSKQPIISYPRRTIE